MHGDDWLHNHIQNTNALTGGNIAVFQVWLLEPDCLGLNIVFLTYSFLFLILAKLLHPLSFKCLSGKIVVILIVLAF